MTRIEGRVGFEEPLGPGGTCQNIPSRTENARLNGLSVDVEFAVLEWVEWFNNRRLLSSIGDIPPAEFEAMYYASQASSTTEVGLN